MVSGELSCITSHPSSYCLPHAGNSSTSDVNFNDEDQIWGQLAFPSYLQSKSKHKPEVCRDFDMAVTAAERRQARDALGLAASMEEDEDEDLEPETAWHTIRCVFTSAAGCDGVLTRFLHLAWTKPALLPGHLCKRRTNRIHHASSIDLSSMQHPLVLSNPPTPPKDTLSVCSVLRLSHPLSCMFPPIVPAVLDLQA